MLTQLPGCCPSSLSSSSSSAVKSAGIFVRGLGKHLCPPKRRLKFLSWRKVCCPAEVHTAGFWSIQRVSGPWGQHPRWDSVWIPHGKTCWEGGRKRPRVLIIVCAFPALHSLLFCLETRASMGIYTNVISLWQPGGSFSGNRKNKFLTIWGWGASIHMTPLWKGGIPTSLPLGPFWVKTWLGKGATSVADLSLRPSRGTCVGR